MLVGDLWWVGCARSRLVLGEEGGVLSDAALTEIVKYKKDGGRLKDATVGDAVAQPAGQSVESECFGGPKQAWEYLSTSPGTISYRDTDFAECSGTIEVLEPRSPEERRMGAEALAAAHEVPCCAGAGPQHGGVRHRATAGRVPREAAE